MALALQTKLLMAGRNSLNFTTSVRNLNSRQLTYTKFGNPTLVVEMTERVVPPLGSQDVLVRMLAAPINPADINIIQGKYPVKPVLPSVAGNEGVGIVEEVGADVKRLCPGNKVVVTKPAQGTWRTFAIFNKNILRPVPDHLGLAEAATLAVNPCTAYRMLSDFKPLREENLVVIQNGANSACGQYVIQMCNAWDIKTVNIVRNRPEIDELKCYLQCLGATYVLTEEELKSTDIFHHKLIPRPALALNCVGGKNALNMLKQMKHSGTMITYGGMSRRPVIVPSAVFIFKNYSCLGFWMTAWNEKADQNEKDKMMADIINLMCENRIKAPLHKIINFDRYKEALDNTLSAKGFAGCKYILDFSSNY